MRLWTYQHPRVLHTLQVGKQYHVRWEDVPNQRWQHAFRWMAEQMQGRGIQTGLFAPVWAWHSVNRLGGKPDWDCAYALLSDFQLMDGIDLIELEVPDHLVLLSNYGPWTEVLYSFIDGDLPRPEDEADCFGVNLKPKRGRPPHNYPDIQACLPYLDPDWLLASEALDTAKMLEERRIALENAYKFQGAFFKHQL
jgi:hypothetical protein